MLRALVHLLAAFLLGSPLLPATARTVLFWSEGFPARPAAARTELLRALGESTATTGDPAELAATLRPEATRLLVLPYGGAFPLRAWPAIRAYLERGGGLLCLGGPPFARPVGGAPGGWEAGREEPSFAQGLGLGPAEELPVPIGGSLRALDSWRGPAPRPQRVWALTLRLSGVRTFAQEEGSQGSPDAALRPLVHVLDAQGVPRACPVLALDRLRGPFAGGRWVLAPMEGAWTEAGLAELARQARIVPVELRAQVHPACARPGERTALRIQAVRPGVTGTWPALRVDGAERPLHGAGEQAFAELELPPATAPGLRRVIVELGGPNPVRVEAGWRVMDEALLRSGAPLTAAGDWLRLDGKVQPIAGTTYFGPGSHRHFLFEPDPVAWERDFARMAEAGVNLVRTGLWTGWSRFMPAPGVLDDGMLRALDAFVLTAAAHRMHVCFTFFAFQPPLWGGANAYLDPRSLEAQRALVGAVAARYRGSPWIHYDLINEPSYSPPDQLWTHRPVGDAHERKGWRSWLEARYGAEPWERLRVLWGDGDPASLPAARDFGYAMARDGRQPRKAQAFARFAQEAVARWAADLRATISAAAGSPVLVTLGQDEGGTGARPMPALHADAVDYTCMHSWWADEDLLFDSLAAKVSGKPSLVQETGLMRLEDVDGRPWRDPVQAAALLERKLVLSLLGRGAGAVQWAWDIDPLLPIDNEAVIGIWRPDGTAKPELDVLRGFARFLRQAAPFLEDWTRPEVGVLFPHGRQWRGRPQVDAGVRRIVRTLAEQWGLLPSLLSDQRGAAADLDGLRLLVVPTLEEAGPEAAAVLQEAQRRGIRVLVLGPLSAEPGVALPEWADPGSGRALALREATPWGPATFADAVRQSLRAGPGSPLRPPAAGVWREPQPLDLAREEAPLRGALAAALKGAGIEAVANPVSWLGGLLRGPKALLWGGTHEGDAAFALRRTLGKARQEAALEPGRSFLRLLDPASGRVLAAYEPAALSRPGDGSASSLP